MTLADLTLADIEKKKKRTPNFPEKYIPKKKFSDKTANDFTAAILFFFEIKGIQAWRQSSEGRFVKGQTATNCIGQTITISKGKFIPRANAATGAGDVSALLPPNGRMLSVEVKIGKDRQRDSQKIFQEKLEASGGVYFITRTWDDFILQISKYVSVVYEGAASNPDKKH